MDNGQPISEQPRGFEMGGPPVNLPPAMDYLIPLEHMVIQQKVSLLEAFTSFEKANKYALVDGMGQRVYYAAEESGCCNRMFCKSKREFDISIVDNAMNEAFHIHRPLRPCSDTFCCVPSCRQELEVSAPVGTTIGFVEQKWAPCNAKFEIQDANKEPVLHITGPCACNCKCCCQDIKFILMDLHGNNVGKISKQWSGLGQEMFTDADNFGIEFPADLDVRVKATAIAAVFLIDFIFFEDNSGGGGVSIGI